MKEKENIYKYIYKLIILILLITNLYYRMYLQ